MRKRLSFYLLAVSSITATAAACGSSSTPDSVSAGASSETPGYAGVDQHRADSRPPDGPVGSVSPEEAWGVPEGDRTPVADAPADGPRRQGFVNWDALAGRDENAPDVSPIYSEPGPSSDEGTVIGYWGVGVGWITVEQFLAPGFDYEQMLRDQQAADALEQGSAAG